MVRLAALGSVLASVVDGGLVHGEGLVVEAQLLLQRADLLGADLGAVHRVVAGLVGQRPADHGGDLDEGGLVGDLLGRLDGLVQLLDLLLVGGAAIGDLDVLTEGDLGVALDGDAVVVVEQDEVAQVLGGSQRAGLGGDALLHAAVAGDAVDVAVEGALARGGVRVEQATLPARGHRHADGHRDAGAQRAGGVLD